MRVLKSIVACLSLCALASCGALGGTNGSLSVKINGETKQAASCQYWAYNATGKLSSISALFKDGPATDKTIPAVSIVMTGPGTKEPGTYSIIGTVFDDGGTAYAKYHPQGTGGPEYMSESGEFVIKTFSEDTIEGTFHFTTKQNNGTSFELVEGTFTAKRASGNY